MQTIILTLGGIIQLSYDTKPIKTKLLINFEVLSTSNKFQVPLKTSFSQVSG
jgi:hypothetical protein